MTSQRIITLNQIISPIERYEPWMTLIEVLDDTNLFSKYFDLLLVY